jgi:hypothetical protein
MSKRRKARPAPAPQAAMSAVVIRGQRVGEVPVSDTPPVWPWLKFSKLASEGITTGDMAGMAALYDVLQAAIHPSGWPAAVELFDKHQPDADDLLRLVANIVSGVTERPTVRPSDVSDGPPTTGAQSEAGSSSPATIRAQSIDEEGWADLIGIEEWDRTRSA